MGLITPPGMENHSGLFRIIMIIILAAAAYRHFQNKEPSDPAPENTVISQPGETRTDTAYTPKPEEIAPPENISIESLAEYGSDQAIRGAKLPIHPDTPQFLTGIHRWTNSKLESLINTPEGKVMANALAQIALEKKAGIKDLTLTLAKATGKADYRDIKAGRGNRAVCGAKASIHMKVTNSNRNVVMDTKQMGTPVEFTVGDNSMIPGIEYLAPGMRVGGQRIMGIPGNLAYDHPTFHNNLVGKGEAIFATVTMLSSEETQQTALPTVSDMPHRMPTADNPPVYCGTPAQATFYRGKNTDLPRRGITVPTFVLGQKNDDAPPIEFHAAIHKRPHNMPVTFTAVKDSPLAQYINEMLYPDAPQDTPVFTVIVRNAPPPGDELDGLDFLDDVTEDDLITPEVQGDVAE